MHLPREAARGTIDATKTAESALLRHRVGAAVTIDTDWVVTLHAVHANYLARDLTESLSLRRRGAIVMAVMTQDAGPAAVWVKVVLVAKLELLDAVVLVGVEVEHRVEALALLVATDSRG